MSQFKVIVSRHVAEALIKHTAFIAQVSPKAADSFVVEYEKVLVRLEEKTCLINKLGITDERKLSQIETLITTAKCNDIWLLKC